MKRMFNFLFVLFLFYGIVGCASPQVTVTSQVTVTLTPTEIPTQTPEPVSEEFNTLQQQIAQTDTHTIAPNQPWEVEIDGIEEGSTVVNFAHKSKGI